MRLTSNRYWICGLFLIALFLAGCGGSNDQRLIELSQDSLKRQAEQNEQMGRQSETVAETTHKLIEADAQARRESIELQHSIQEERGSLDRQHEDLENERREIAASRQRDPVIANAITSAAMLLAACMPLIVCLFLVRGLYRQSDDDALAELLVSELAGTEPALFAPSTSNSPRLEEQSPATHITSETRPDLPVDSSTVSQQKQQPVLVIVEGKHDIAFLKRISAILHADDPRVPDLGELETQGRMIFVPTGGGSLKEWQTRFAGLHLREFHVFDREVPPLTEERRRVVQTVNSRAGCLAFLTQKRALENYLHSAALREARGIDVSFNDNNDVPELIARTFLQQAGGTDWENISRRARRRLRDKTKRWLNTEAVDRMTAQRLAERDPDGEVRGWLLAIAELAGVTTD